MKVYNQQHTAARTDGHTADGIAGDCLRAAVATVLKRDPDSLRRYATYRSWWDAMRLDARGKFGRDWYCTTPEQLHTWNISAGDLLIASGPSPRGPFWHAVVVNRSLTMVHDPHPSRAGLMSIEELFILWDEAYEPGPVLASLEAGAPQR